MKTLILDSPGRFDFAETREPAHPPPGTALVQVRRIGVCGTDIHAYNGRQPFFTYPRILGHELGVEILEVTENPQGLVRGDLCCVEPYLNCGHCIACRRGKSNCCTSLQVLGVHVDGGHQERILVPTAKLHRSAALTLDQLALVETLGIGAHAVDRAALQPGETALVIGTGPIGMAVIQFAKAAGARVIAMDVNGDRLAFCRSALHADQVLQAGPGLDLQHELAGMTNGDMPTAVFDATGSSKSMMASFLFPAHGGRLVFVGLFQGDVTFNDPNFHKRELTLLASRNARSQDFTRIIKRIEEGAVDTTSWITHRAPFGEAAEAFAGWVKPEAGVIKAMIEV